MNQRIISPPEEIDFSSLFGSFDSNIKLLEKGLSVTITSRDNVIKVSGEDENIDKANEVLNILMQAVLNGEVLDEQKVLYAMTMVQENGGADLKLLGDDCVAINHRGAPIKTKTLGQKNILKISTKIPLYSVLDLPERERRILPLPRLLQH